MVMKKWIFIISIIVLINNQSFCQKDNDNFHLGKQVEIVGCFSDSLIDGYLLYLPKTYTKQKSWPIIIFLQGGGGVGGDISRIASWGLPKLLITDNLSGQVNDYMKDSFIVVSPHMTDGSFEERQWYNQEKGIQEIMDEVINTYNGDSSKVYLTGLCRGGAGTWGLASKMSERFAAIVPLCGLSSCVVGYDKLINIPIWVAHSKVDNVIDYSESYNIVSKLEEISDIEFLRLNTPSAYKFNYLEHSHIFTTFDRESHDAWSGMYDRVEVYKWMLKNKNAL